MKNKIANLIDVKTIVTFVVIFVFAYLAIKGRISADNVMLIVTSIISFFFAKNLNNNKEDK